MARLVTMNIDAFIDFVTRLNEKATAGVRFSIVDTSVWSMSRIRDGEREAHSTRSIAVSRAEGEDILTLGTLSLDDEGNVKSALIYKDVPFSKVPKAMRDIAV